MGGIETLIVLAMTPFYLAIVPGSKRPDQLMLYAIPFQMNLK